MKRASVIGPLILIAIGVLFLLKNLLPELPLLDFLARNWPFLLIAWGALRLIELLYWFSKGRPLPANGLSGGEWFLVVILSLLGSGLFLARRGDSWLSNARISVGGFELFNDDFNYPVTSTVKVPKVGRLVIESFRGDAQITGSADVSEVRITGKKSIHAPQQSEADRIDKDTPIEVAVEGDRVVVRLNQSRGPNNKVRHALEIVVPKSYAVEARGRYGDFDVRDVNGAVDLYSDNAGVRLDNLTGPVMVETRRSDIVRATGLKGPLELRGRGSDLELEHIDGQITVNASYSGTVQLRAISKPVRMECEQLTFQAERVDGEVHSTLGQLDATNVVGPIRIASRRTRDIRLTNYTQSLDLDIPHGNVTLEPSVLPLGKMNVKTRNGDIELSLPEQAKFELQASTTNGDTDNDWGDALRKVSTSKRRASLAGVVGQQGPVLTLSTDRGSFVIHKRTPGLAAAQPPAAQNPPVVPAAPVAPKAPMAPPERRIE